MKQHGGVLSAASGSGPGASFLALFPIARDGVVGGPVTAPPEPGDREGTATILVAADDARGPAPSRGPTPEQMEAGLQGLESAPIELPDDATEAAAQGAIVAAAVEDGRLPGVIVGVTLAETLGLEMGDHVRIISPLAGLDTMTSSCSPARIATGVPHPTLAFREVLHISRPVLLSNAATNEPER